MRLEKRPVVIPGMSFMLSEVDAAGAAFMVIPGMSFMLSEVDAAGAAFVVIPGMSFIFSMPCIPFIPPFIAGAELGAFLIFENRLRRVLH